MKKQKSKGSKKARSSAARLAAVQTVYQMRTSNQSALEAARVFLDHYAGMSIEGERLLEPDTELYSKIVQGVENRLDDLQTLLIQSMKNSDEDIDSYKKRPIEPLLEAILLCGIFELMAHKEIDTPIIISDYLNVTHAFYEKSELGLVNALLDRLARVLVQV